MQPTPELRAHVIRANRALAYLKSRNVHFEYTSKGTTYSLHGIEQRLEDIDDIQQDVNVHIEYRTGIHIDPKDPLIVSTRSDFLVEGLALNTQLKQHKEKKFLKQVMVRMGFRRPSFKSHPMKYWSLTQVRGRRHMQSWR